VLHSVAFRQNEGLFITMTVHLSKSKSNHQNDGPFKRFGAAYFPYKKGEKERGEKKMKVCSSVWEQIHAVLQRFL